MAHIKIEWLHDSSDCETCGVSYAEGARVFVDGSLALELNPVAHCFGGASFDDADVFASVLKHLGHELDDGRSAPDEETP